MTYSREALDRASALALKGFKLFDGTTIVAMRASNYADKEFVPVRELHTDKERGELKKIVKKGGMK